MQLRCARRSAIIAGLLATVGDLPDGETLGHPAFVIALRFKNTVAFAWSRMETWGLKDETMSQDAWAYVNITTILDGHTCLDSDCDAAVFFVAS
jgi:hypothetical protein